jgi:chromosomal replication initiation ATPase DnaA
MPGRLAMNDQLRLPLQSDVPMGAATFVRSSSNDAAVRVLERWPDAAGQVMAICGPAGCGKSHLRS